MSHLIIEQGGEVGKEIAVPSTGIKFGRSPANDLVLTEESVMLFQGRFFFKPDGSLWVTDFSAAEKTTVGGEPIDEYALKVGDLVEVGPNAFRVIATTLEGGAATPAAETPSEEIDLGFNPSKKASRPSEKKERTKRQTITHRVLQVAVVLLILLVIAIAAPELSTLSGTKVAPVPVKEKSLAFTYECVRADHKNIFRYYLKLTTEGVASIQIDNLGNRHISETAEISPEALEKLSRRLGGSGFFEINRDYVLSAPSVYESFRIAIYRNGKFNQVRVLNREGTKDFGRTVAILEDFVFSELGVPLMMMEDDETLIRSAGESFKLAEARFSERDVRPGNLAQAVKHYKAAAEYLEAIDPKPDLYDRAKHGLKRSVDEQDIRYKDYKFNADRAMRLGDWREAEKQLRILAELIPDRKDDRHEIISSKQLEVEDHLR